MLKFIIQALFGLKTVDSVMGHFHKTLDELAEVRMQHQVFANQKLEASANLIKEANEHLTEVKKSNIIQSKMESIFLAVDAEDVTESFSNVTHINQLRTENSAVEKVMAG
jgi:chaperonin cofactor prefoldin